MSQRAPPKPEADLGSAAEPLMPRCSRKRESAKMRRLFSLFRSFALSLSPSFVGSSSSARCCCCVVVDRCAKASAYTLDTCSPVRLKAMDDLDEEILGIVRSSVGTECMATPLTHSIDIDIDITLALSLSLAHSLSLSRSLSHSLACVISRAGCQEGPWKFAVCCRLPPCLLLSLQLTRTLAQTDATRRTKTTMMIARRLPTLPPTLARTRTQSWTSATKRSLCACRMPPRECGGRAANHHLLVVVLSSYAPLLDADLRASRSCRSRT